MRPDMGDIEMEGTGNNSTAMNVDQQVNKEKIPSNATTEIQTKTGSSAREAFASILEKIIPASSLSSASNSTEQQQQREQELRNRLKRQREDGAVPGGPSSKRPTPAFSSGPSASSSSQTQSTKTARPAGTMQPPSPSTATASGSKKSPVKKRIVESDTDNDETQEATQGKAPSRKSPPSAINTSLGKGLSVSSSQLSTTSSTSSTASSSSSRLIPVVEVPQYKKSLVARKSTGGPRTKAAGGSKQSTPAPAGTASPAPAPGTTNAGFKVKLKMPARPSNHQSEPLERESEQADSTGAVEPDTFGAQDMTQDTAAAPSPPRESLFTPTPSPGPDMEIETASATVTTSAPALPQNSADSGQSAAATAPPATTIAQPSTTRQDRPAPFRVPAGQQVIEISDTSSSSSDEDAPLRSTRSTAAAASSTQTRSKGKGKAKARTSSSDSLPDLPTAFSQQARAGTNDARPKPRPSATMNAQPAASTSTKPPSRTSASSSNISPPIPTAATAAPPPRKMMRKGGPSAAAAGRAGNTRRKSTSSSSDSEKEDESAFFRKGPTSSRLSKTTVPQNSSIVATAAGSPQAGRAVLPQSAGEADIDELEQDDNGDVTMTDQTATVRELSASYDLPPPLSSHALKSTAHTTNGMADTEQATRIPSSPPFEVGSPPPASFDFLSPELDSQPRLQDQQASSSTSRAIPANATAAEAMITEPEFSATQIASSQSPEAQQLTDAEMELGIGQDGDEEAEEAQEDARSIAELKDAPIDELESSSSEEEEVQMIVQATPEPPKKTSTRTPSPTKANKEMYMDLSQSLLADMSGQPKFDGSIRARYGSKERSSSITVQGGTSKSAAMMETGKHCLSNMMVMR